MAHARIVHRFPVSADALWALIGDFGDTTKWSGSGPDVCRAEGKGVGSLRTLKLPTGAEIVDRLTAQGSLSYSYEVVSGPLPVETYEATMSVQPVDAATCDFTWVGHFTPKDIPDAAATAFFEGVYRQGIGMMEKQLGISLEGSVG